MCIRDRFALALAVTWAFRGTAAKYGGVHPTQAHGDEQAGRCLLYTSEAADARTSGDLGCRRLSKKKNTVRKVDIR